MNTKILTSENFDEVVLQNAKPSIVDFWGDGCAPCKVIAPIIDEIADDYAGRVNVAKVKIEDAPDLAAKYGVRGVPTTIFFIDGEPKTRIVGAAPKKQFIETFEAVSKELFQ